jgi:hypothetical protein
MTEQSSGVPPSQAELRANLAALAELLRKKHHIGPDVQARIAELVQEMNQALASSPGVPSAEVAALASSTGGLVQALRGQADTGALGEARDRLDRAILAAEARAPFAAGIVQRLVDVLTDLGI